MLRFWIFAIVFGLGLSSQAAVWNETSSWNASAEARFSQWVREEWNIHFFDRPTLRNGQKNPYYGLRSDCADTVYAMRIVFAYENRLPFVMQDPTASGRTISNRMGRWDSQHESVRIRQFLLYIFQVGSTKSLPNDTYPVAVNRSAIRAGSLILTTTRNHHSWTVKEMMSFGVPHLVFNSTIGATSGSTLQERKSWPNPEWVFEGNFTPSGNAGFRYWRPAAYLNRPVWEVPGYSEEQYRIPMRGWVRTVQSRLATHEEGDDQMVSRMFNSICQGLRGRISSVNEGLAFLRRNPSCMSQADYDTYSTPSRDQRIFDDMMALRQAYREILSKNGGNRLNSSSLAALRKVFPHPQSSAAQETAQMGQSPVSSASVCVTEYRSGRSMDIAEFKRRMFAGLISNNPNETAEYRWGESRGPSERARRCKSWDNWRPNLN